MSKRSWTTVTLLGLVSTTMLACAANSHQVDDEGASRSRAPRLSASMPVLPWAGGTGEQAPWGGGDPNRWRPEAILANAASEALNGAWSLPNVRDAVVAMPVRMLNSGYREFGDGQANAVASLEWWAGKRPPVVATLLMFDGAPSRVTFRFDRALGLSGNAFDLRYDVGGTTRTAALAATKTAAGDWVANWAVPGELGWESLVSQQVVLIHPRGWGDWFPVWFRFPVKSVDALRASVPADRSAFLDGGSIVDHEKMSLQATPAAATTPFQQLMSHAFSPGYTPNPFQPGDIHARFPWGGRTYVTGVGKGWTWVADMPAAPFKIMYTCFERRRPDLEASAPDGGVASGGGWHKIGDPAETILNDLETGPLAVGSAMNNPYPASQLPSGGFAYNLSDVATVRWLRPGEAFVTPNGGTFVDGNGTAWDQSNYHWYFFQQAREVCTEEWVHPCTPTSWDFSCGAQSAVQLQIGNAFTSWGQNVYVVGDAKELGAWDPTKAVKLAPTRYPNWSATVLLPQGARVQFKFVKIDGVGRVTWEGGGDRAMTVPSSSTGTYSGSWQ